MSVVSFPLRLILYLLQNPVARALLALIAIVLILGAVFPGAIYFYPVWKATVSDSTSAPFAVVEDTLHTEVIHPNRLIPDRSYRMRVEISNNRPFTSSQEVELQIWEEDPHIFFEDIDTSPILITHTFHADDIGMFVDVLDFSMGNIERPYESTRFNVRLASLDGNFVTGINIPIDFYSVPVVALIVIAIPLLVALVKFIR